MVKEEVTILGLIQPIQRLEHNSCRYCAYFSQDSTLCPTSIEDCGMCKYPISSLRRSSGILCNPWPYLDRFAIPAACMGDRLVTESLVSLW